MIWTEIEIKTTPMVEDAVTELFYTAGANGVGVESVENLLAIQDDPTINYIDEGILNMDPGEITIKGYFPDEVDVTAALAVLNSGMEKLPEYGLNPGDYKINCSEMEEEDWANSWKQYYKPTRVGEHIIIKPTWEDYEPERGDLIINMDPGMAFGTGTHETTQLCVAAMEREITPGKVVYDIGTGTGILAIIAAKLGAENIIGIDLDPVACTVAKENLAINAVADLIEIREGDLVEVLKEDEQADVIVANILAEAIVMLTAAIKPFLKPGGTFISSGIILERLPLVLETLEQHGFMVEKVETLGDWNSVTARTVDQE